MEPSTLLGKLHKLGDFLALGNALEAEQHLMNLIEESGTAPGRPLESHA